MIRTLQRGKNLTHICGPKPFLISVGTRHEDFQSSYRTGTMCHYRSLLVSIQAFNGALKRSILPIRTHRDI